MRRTPLTAISVALLLVALVLAALGVGEATGKLSDWQAFTLGIVQGLTELLPVSSSGHLILVPWLGDWHYLKTHESFNKTFDVALHLGTLVAVVVYFAGDIGRLVAAWFRSVGARAIRDDDERVAWYVLAATIPAALIGAAGESVIEKHLGEPWLIAINLAVFGVILYVADRRPERREISGLSLPMAIAVGFAQAIALMPGVSRSGITITFGRFLGLTRDAAARFSFLLLVPIVLGAVVLKTVKDVLPHGLPSGSAGPFVVGTLAAAGAGLIAIRVLLDYVRSHDYTLFVVYRIAVAAAVLIVIATGARAATF